MNSTQLTALIRREGSRATSCLDSLHRQDGRALWQLVRFDRDPESYSREVRGMVQHGLAYGAAICSNMLKQQTRILRHPYEQIKFAWTVYLSLS